PGHPRHTGQYSVECHKFTDPYIALYDPASMKRICGIPLYSGTFMTADPGLVWNVLLEYFNVIKLPLSGSFALPDDLGCTRAYIAFGCGKQYAKGYGMQRASDIEEVFDFDTARPVKTGKKEGAEYIGVTSDSEKTIDLIPDGVYDRGAVVSHLKKNHFFCESEDIVFSAGFVTRKSFISMSAYLCDAFGDRIGVFASERTGGGWRFIHEPLPVGVYRAGFEVFYGDTLYQTREITFEVYDPSGERCAPIESGLPFLFSMPNEQKYLDRDAFDLYNPAPDCDMEHYYSASGMPGDIGMKKRIWETNSIFGRKWYVWDSWHRTLTKEEFSEYGEELIRRSDYCYYPVPYEWAVMRHDPLNTVAFAEGWDNAAGLYGSGIMGYLRDFLALHPEIDIGVTPDSRSLTQDQLDRLLSSHIREWLDYANKRINEDFRKNTEWMRSVNPDVKRACYGPFNLYAGPVFTHHGCRYVGFEPEGSLAEYMFDGFAQLEDYPYSCAYHTYQGAFFVSNVLLHNPGLRIYPEEYTASEGGCIDGAVKDAHPPLGRYDMQPYFNVTHSYEYVYNTAYLTEDGFGYWRDRGFMQRDFTAEFVDAFVRGWKNVLKHEPDRPLRSIAYLSEIPTGEDRWNKELSCVSNQSNSGVSYVYETARLSGLPNGFTVSYGSLQTLAPEMTDCLVITSMSYAPAHVIAKIRELYASGVSLIAVGDVAGLEDIFGVSDDSRTGMIYRLTAPDGSHERIFPNEAEFRYRSEEAETLLSASGDDGEHPVLLKKDRALLINADIDKLGCQTYGVRAPNYYAANISRFLRESLAGAMSVITRPVAVSDGCGITLLKDRNGETLLLAVDYSDYDLADKDRTWESNITFNIGGITGAEAVYGEKPIVLSDGEEVRGISVR
ncbi:MAG: hypothetical protein K6D94_08025, partial [Clostridiales bacterium]|nr:hypothetical protein [Clostridiales bacterium]